MIQQHIIDDVFIQRLQTFFKNSCHVFNIFNFLLKLLLHVCSQHSRKFGPKSVNTEV